MKLNTWFVLQIIIIFALSALTFWLVDLGIPFGVYTGALAVLLSLLFSFREFREKNVFASVMLIVVGAALLGCMLVPIWDGHHGFSGYHSHYIWDVGHDH